MKSRKQVRWTTWPHGTIVPMEADDEHNSSRQMTQFSGMVKFGMVYVKMV